MTQAQQALTYLSQCAAKAPMTQENHIQAVQAAQFLAQHIAPKGEGPSAMDVSLLSAK